MSGDDLDGLLEHMVPGAGHRTARDADAPDLPAGLDLTPDTVLARGSVGWVYRAHDPVLDRWVAVKVSRAEAGEQGRAALLNEARVTARLAHPAVLPVHRVVAVDGLLCVVFALGPETTMADVIHDWRHDSSAAWSQETRLQCLHAVVEAVAHAHRQGVVHGDLKPSNVAVDAAAHPYVLDWSGLVSNAGTFSGTPEFAAPEQLRGDAPTAASDVYALAALAWELSTLRALRPARAGESVGDYLARHAAAREPAPPPPRVEAGVAELLSRATHPDPSERPTAETLANALDRARTGRAQSERRAEEAESELVHARRQLLSFQEREQRLQQERRVIAVQRMQIPPHAPASAKASLWANEARADALLDEQAEAFTAALEHAVRAAHLAPDADEPHALIAELWWQRLIMTEARSYEGESRLAMARIRQHDRGRYVELLDAPATLSIRGTGEVRLRRVVPSRPASTERLVSTHPLPLGRLELEPGSWSVDLVGPQGVRASVWLERLVHLQLDLQPPASIPEGYTFVPPGPFRMGGDPMARTPVEPCSPWLDGFLAAQRPVSSDAYLAFLASLPEAQARARGPAQRLVSGEVAPLWTWTAAGWALPDGWAGDWPVVGVSSSDATAYAQWRSQVDGTTVRLPTEEEWEKAARGADGRPFPWGEHFDPALCHMRQSIAGAPRLLPVGSFPEDRSPYGLVDVAGGVREWTTSVFAGERRVVRGGSWASDAQGCRLASRGGLPEDSKDATVGFRLVGSLSP